MPYQGLIHLVKSSITTVTSVLPTDRSFFACRPSRSCVTSPAGVSFSIWMVPGLMAMQPPALLPMGRPSAA